MPAVCLLNKSDISVSNEPERRGRKRERGKIDRIHIAVKKKKTIRKYCKRGDYMANTRSEILIMTNLKKVLINYNHQIGAF
jgi:hypothetical protein